jgi:AraC-like DNA-binding protein
VPEHIRFHPYPLAGVDAMSAMTVRSFPRHTHDQYGIGIIDFGGHASHSGRGPVEAGPGNLIFVNPGEVHDGRAIGGRSRSWRMLYIDPTFMDATRADIMGGAAASITFASPVFADEPLRALFDAAFTHAATAKENRDRMACETAILRLTARLEVNSANAARISKHPAGSIRRARERIDADPTAPLLLAELAREAGLSRYQLIRGFSRELGLTPHAYIVQQRVAVARRLMRAGQTLAAAAMIAGFYDQSHFNRHFVRQFGVTPARYVLKSR